MTCVQKSVERILVADTYVCIYQFHDNIVDTNTCLSGAKLLTILDPKDMYVNKHLEKYYVLLSILPQKLN